MIKLICITLIIFSLFTNFAFAQGSEDYKQGLRVKFNEEGNRYLRFIIWNQMWARYTEYNPGTQVNGLAKERGFDLGARRIRFLAYAQISPRYLILTHFGINNQTFVGGGVPSGGLTGNGGTETTGKKPALFFHDFWNEYALIPKRENQWFSASVGMGLHYWNGVSRLSSASTLNFMTLDAPIFNWYNIDFSDQFARQFGLYFKGYAQKLDYRLALNRPFATNQALPSVQGEKVLNRAVDNNRGSDPWSFSGYLAYNFFELESNFLPYTVGTYVGTKKVLNLGGGFYHSAKATQSYQVQGLDTLAVHHAVSHFGLDVFMDLPLKGEDNWAITNYSLAAHYDYGPNYQRNVGIMNVGTANLLHYGPVSEAGFGNARPLLGTGWILHSQWGLLLPKSLLPQSKHRLQVFAATTAMRLEHLQSWTRSYDLGLNYFLDGHHAKIGLQYSSRPLIYQAKQAGQRGEIIFQTQVFL